MDTYVGLAPRAPFLLFSVGTGVTMPVPPSTRQYSRVPTGGTNTGTWEKIDLPPNIDEWLGLRGSGIEKFWFETLWIVPLVVDVGIISEETSVPVYKYNSQRHDPMLVSAIDNHVDPDTWLDDIPETPYFVPSQTSEPFSVVVSEEGDVLIDGYFLFTTSVDQYRLYVLGQRMVIFDPTPEPDLDGDGRPLPDDENELLTPETPITEVLEWKTDIVANVYGEEQRIGVRRFPRQFLRYEYRARRSHARRSLVSLLHGWQGKNYLLPVWPDAHYPTQPIVATSPDQDIFVDTSWGDFRERTMVYISDGYNAEVALIQGIHSGRLATTPLVLNYPTSAMVMPCRSSRLTESQGVKRYPIDMEVFDLLFQVIDNDTGLFGYGTTALLFNGRPVLDDPNMLIGGTLDEGVFTKQQVLDTGVGEPWFWSFWEQSRVSTKKTWFCRTRKEAWELRRFLYYLHGSRRTFYVPTFYADLSVQRTIAASIPHMDIKPINYHRFLKGNEPLNAMQVLLWNGARLNFLVTNSEAVTDGGTNYERLHLDPVPPYEIKPESIRAVSFMRLCRLADDVAKFTYHASGETVIEVNLIGVQG